MVRLVFRPYTQVRRSICTSEPLRASTRVSSGFTLLRHSSPSFGSQQIRSHSKPATAWLLARPAMCPGFPPGSRIHEIALTSPVPNTWVFQAEPKPRHNPSDLRISCTPWSVFQDGSQSNDSSPVTLAQNLDTTPRDTTSRAVPHPTPQTSLRRENGTQLQEAEQPQWRPDLPQGETAPTNHGRTAIQHTWKTTETTAQGYTWPREPEDNHKAYLPHTDQQATDSSRLTVQLRLRLHQRRG